MKDKYTKNYEVKTEWSSDIYPCSKYPECGYIGPLDAFSFGSCYRPCPRCGSPKKNNKNGRFVYNVVENFKWLPWPRWIKTKTFVRVEWSK